MVVKKYSEEQINEALDAVKNGMKVSDVAELMGMHYTSIYDWMHLRGVPVSHPEMSKRNNFKVIKPLKVLKTIPIVVPLSKNEKMTLEEFVCLLHSLINDYERVKNELHVLRRQLESWQQTAGKLNTQLQSVR